MQPSAEPLSNQELVARIRQSDAEAEAVLYEKFYARVYFTALSETHSKEDAEDVRAETFLRVIQALRQDKLRSADSLPSFIVGITLNVIRELIRQKYRLIRWKNTNTTSRATARWRKSFWMPRRAAPWKKLPAS